MHKTKMVPAVFTLPTNWLPRSNPEQHQSDQSQKRRRRKAPHQKLGLLPIICPAWNYLLKSPGPEKRNNEMDGTYTKLLSRSCLRNQLFGCLQSPLQGTRPNQLKPVKKCEGCVVNMLTRLGPGSPFSKIAGPGESTDLATGPALTNTTVDNTTQRVHLFVVP